MPPVRAAPRSSVRHVQAVTARRSPGGADAVRLREAGVLHPSDAYVFRTSGGSPWRYPDFHSDRWVPARTKQHDGAGQARHAAHGPAHHRVVGACGRVRIEVFYEQLGHASLQMTYDVHPGLVKPA
jgi:hypothetical protein